MSDPKPAFAQCGETAEHSDDVWVQVDQFTPEKVQNRNEKLAGGKAKPRRKMRLKADNSGIVYCQKFQIRDKGFYPIG
jgi:phage pi2 protein 07